MKVIFFTKYTRKGASSRLRTFQFIDYYERNGVTCVISPFFSDVYLQELYLTRKHNRVQALKSFVRRLFVLTQVFSADLLVIEKELFPYFPAICEWLLNKLGRRYIVDYDDAIFHNYDQSTNPVIRKLLSGKIASVMRNASVVVGGNSYLCEYAERSGAKKIVLIPTVVDIEKYVAGKQHSTDDLVIGWIGSPITAKYLHFLKPVFLAVATRTAIKVRLIGAGKSFGLEGIAELVPWTEDSEVEKIGMFDIGIMPLEDNIWERGKCGYKLIQYMACSIPVIGTPIGVNTRIIRNGVNGFIAATLKEWEDALVYFINNRFELKIMGEAGRQIVEADFSLQRYEPVWLELLKRTAQKD